jgi:hypothetical protein
MRKRMMIVLAGLTTAGLIASATPASANATTLYRVDPVDGWGQDGTAYAVTIAGGRVFAGGSFLNAARYQQRVARQNLMAVSESNGALIPPCIGATPCFGPGPNGAWTNGTVRAMANDSLSIYIAGDFTQVNGQPRTRIARLDLNGNLLPLNVSAPKAVRDLLVVGSTLYVVGDFGTVTGSNGVATTRKRAAAFDVNSGNVLPFNPNLSGKANAVARGAANRGTIYLGGAFLTVGGQARRYLAAVDPTSGAIRQTDPTFDQVGDVILDISVSDDGSRVFVAGGGGFNSAAAWTASTGGRPVWTQRANGDVQAVKYSNGNVYFGFHDGFNGNTRLRLLAVDAATGILEQSFQPISGGTPGPVALEADGNYLVVGGKFPRMGAIRVKGLSIHP